MNTKMIALASVVVAMAAWADVPTPDVSLGFDKGKGASAVLGGTAPTSIDNWAGTAVYTAFRNKGNYSLTIVGGTDESNAVRPNAQLPTGMNAQTSWSVQGVMKLREVENGVLFGMSPAVWDNCKYIGLEYASNNQVRVSYGSAAGAANKRTMIAPVTIPGSKDTYHAYLLTFDAGAAGTAESPFYTLYVDGVKVGDSGATPAHSGYATRWCLGNYYGGAKETGAAIMESAKIDDFAIWKDTCLSAEQAAELAAQFPVVAEPHDKQMLYRLALDGNANKTGTGAQVVTKVGPDSLNWVTSPTRFGTGCFECSTRAAHVIDNIETTREEGWTLSFWFNSHKMGEWLDVLALAIGDRVGKFERMEEKGTRLAIYTASEDPSKGFGIEPALTYTADAWTHIALVSTATGFDVYNNGVKSSSVTVGGDAGLTKVIIGCAGYYDPRPSAALVDEVAVFNWAMTAADLAELQTSEASMRLYHKFGAAVAGEPSFSDLTWQPNLPSTGMPDDATVTLSNDVPAKVTLDEATTVWKFAVRNPSDGELVIGDPGNLTTASFDFSAASGGVGFDATSGYVATDALKACLRDSEVQAAFYGADEQGATLDYGVANTASTKAHYAFDGGRHAFTFGSNLDTGILAFSTTGTLDNPAILIRENTTLDFTTKDLNGWNGGLQASSVIRVADGATLNFLPSGTSTMFMNGRLVMEPGSTTTFKTESPNNGFCVYGGNGAGSDNTRAQLYVPSPSSGRAASPLAAVLKKAGTKSLEFGKSPDATGGAAITVEKGATLDIQSPITGNQSVAKYGTGTLKLSDAVSGFSGYLTAYAGTIAMGNVYENFSVYESHVQGTANSTLSFDLGKDNTMKVYSFTTDPNRMSTLEVTSGTLSLIEPSNKNGVSSLSNRKVRAAGGEAVISLDVADATGWGTGPKLIEVADGATLNVARRDTLKSPVAITNATVALAKGSVPVGMDYPRALDLFGNNDWTVWGTSDLTVVPSTVGENRMLLRNENWNIDVPVEGDTFTVYASLIANEVPTSSAPGTRGGIVKTGKGKLILMGESTYETGTTVSGGTVQVAASNALGSGAVSLASGAKLELFAEDGADLALGNAISGAGRLEKLGPGTYTLAQAGTYTGGTIVSAGILKIGADGALGSGPLAFDGGTLDLDGHMVTTTSVLGDGTVTNTSDETAYFNGIPVVPGGSYDVRGGLITIEVKKGEVLTMRSVPPNDTVLIYGAGHVEYTNATELVALPAGLWGEKWTGTFVLGGCGSVEATDWDIASYYNGTNSVFEFGVVREGSAISYDKVTGGGLKATSSPVELGELRMTGKITLDTNPQPQPSTSTYTFTALSGTRTLTLDGAVALGRGRSPSAPATSALSFGDVSDFTGELRCTDGAIHLVGEVPFGNATLVATDGVIVHSNAVVRLVDATAEKQRIMKVQGCTTTFEDGSALVMDNRYCQFVSDSPVVVDETVTIPLTLNDTANIDKPLMTWSERPLGYFKLVTDVPVEPGNKVYAAQKEPYGLIIVESVYLTFDGTVMPFEEQWLKDAGVWSEESLEETEKNLALPNENGISPGLAYMLGFAAEDAAAAHYALTITPQPSPSSLLPSPYYLISLTIPTADARRNGLRVVNTLEATPDVQDWTDPRIVELNTATSFLDDRTVTGAPQQFYRVHGQIIR